MNLRSHIVEAQKEAMKSKDTVTLGVVRLVYAAIRNSEIDKGRELTDEEVMAVLRTQSKQLQDAIKDFELGGRTDLVETSQHELEIIKKFLPAEMSDEEMTVAIENILSQADASANIGSLMGLVMKELKGKADGNRVRAMLENKFKK